MACVAVTWQALVLTLVMAGCSRPARDRSLRLSPTQLVEIARQQRQGVVAVRDGDEVLFVGPEHDPRVELEVVPCEPVEEFKRICRGTTLPLDRLRALADGTVHPGVHAEDVTRATLRIDNYLPPGWRPTYGIGMSFLGPAPIAGIDGQWLPIEQLALQVGLPFANVAGGYGAFRLRVPRDPITPWVGAFATGLCWLGTDEHGNASSECMAAVAARVGVDWSFENGTFLLTPELDLLFPLNTYLGVERAGTLWGGVTASWMF